VPRCPPHEPEQRAQVLKPARNRRASAVLELPAGGGPLSRLPGESMRPKHALVVALALLLAALAPVAAHAAKPKTRYYLALGDSLSVGVQPDAAGTSVETSQGYPNQLLALKRRSIPG